MSRARDLASSGVTSTVLSEKAPLASPDFTGQIDLTGTEALIKLEDSDSNVAGQGFIDFDGSSLQLNTHRNPNTGANNNNKAPASIIMSGNDVDSSIGFYTKNSNSGAATKRLGIDKLGSITTPNGEFNGTLGSNATFPSGVVTNVLHFWTTGNEYSNTGTTLKAMVTSNSFSAISGKKYYIITSFNAWPYKGSGSDDNYLTEWYLYTGTTSRTQGTSTFTNDTDQGKQRIGNYFSGNTTNGLNAYRSVTLQGSFTASSTTTYYFHIVSKGLSANMVTRIKTDENHPWRTTIFEVQP